MGGRGDTDKQAGEKRTPGARGQAIVTGTIDRTGVLFSSEAGGGHEGKVRATPKLGAGGDDRLSNLLDRVSGSQSGLPDKANDVESAGQDVSQKGSLGSVGFAEPRGAFDAPAGLVSVAAFGVALATHAQFPGGRVDLQVASKTDVTIGKSDVNSDDTTQGVFRVPVRTSSGRRENLRV